jgi:hypothetical protein
MSPPAFIAGVGDGRGPGVGVVRGARPGVAGAAGGASEVVSELGAAVEPGACGAAPVPGTTPCGAEDCGAVPGGAGLGDPEAA